MAKSRRSRGAHGDRLEARQVKPPSDPELIALRESKIVPVMRQLQSDDAGARTAAAVAVSNFVRETKCRKLLLREQVVHTILTQTLAHPAVESRAAGWEILKLLAMEEEEDFCVHLFRQEIMTAIASAAEILVKRVPSSGTSLFEASGEENGFMLRMTASIVSLLTALAEAGDEMLEVIGTTDTILQLLFTLVCRGGGHRNLRADSLGCLIVLCEDNVQLAEKMIASGGHQCFETMMAMKNDRGNDGVRACAVLHNIFASLNTLEHPPRIPNADDAALIPTLTNSVSSITEPPAGTDWPNIVEQQELALETLASICANLSANPGGSREANGGNASEEAEADGGMDEDEDEDDMMDEDDEMGEDDDDDEMDEDEMEADMAMVTGADDDDDDDGINDFPALKALLQETVSGLLSIINLSDVDERTMRLQGHALTVLTNLAWSVSLFDFTDEQNAGIKKAWTPSGHNIWVHAVTTILSRDTADLERATEATSLAWALSRSLGAEAPVAADEHKKFISLYMSGSADYRAAQDEANNKADPLQSLGVKCIGVLGQLALDPAPASRNRDIGNFYLTLLGHLPRTPAADAVEALNQMLDIYADENHACDKDVFWKDNFMSRLEEALPKVRAMVKSVDRVKNAELRSRADEVLKNLDRFLAYKKKHKPSMM
ncbi:hypothetical protein RJ55_06291 [Drechmeria coniospora]|nr:hypothetical protein RJ55_06291 [Drechmeria coniospora]